MLSKVIDMLYDMNDKQLESGQLEILSDSIDSFSEGSPEYQSAWIYLEAYNYGEDEYIPAGEKISHAQGYLEGVHCVLKALGMDKVSY